VKDNNTNAPDDFGERITGWHNFMGWGDSNESLAPYVPTPRGVVKSMLEIANAGPEDIVIDLGCGDGRILIMAVEEFEVKRAIGYELNKQLVETAKNNIYNKGLQDRIQVTNVNFMEVDLKAATLVTLYLTTTGNSKLRPKFIKELQKGTRIVSHDFPIVDWITMTPNNEPIKIGSHKIFNYKIPDAYKTRLDEIEKSSDKRWKRLRDLLDRL